MARVEDVGSMAIDGAHLANRLVFGYWLSGMWDPRCPWNNYNDGVYLLTEDGNIFHIFRGGSLAGIGHNLAIQDLRTGHSVALDDSAFQTCVQAGTPFSYKDTKGNEHKTPVVTEAIGVHQDYQPREELANLPACDLYERCNQMFEERRKKANP